MVGAAGAFTSSGSRGLALGGHFYFAENKYQASFAFGKGRANYDFYGVGRVPGSEGVVVEMNQSGSVFFAEFMRNVGKKIFIGPRYQYRKLTASLGGGSTPGGFEIPAIDLTSTTSAIGIHVQRDLRDNGFYPRSGSLFDFKADFFAKAIGSNRTYQTYSVSYNGYHSISKKQVIAYRGMACSVSDSAPFFDLCFYGSNDLRGYTSGEFQDRRKFATQVEFRQELPYRLGIVGFAGFGGVAPEWQKFQFKKLLPAAGIGIRFKLDKTNNINYRVDLGFGRNGHTLSLSVTEAF
jgi:outer membrane protein assembly factor BamA